MSNFDNKFHVYQWDNQKRNTNIEKHGIDFVAAVRIFEGPVWETPSHRDEPRWQVVGVVDNMEVTVIYTVRNGNRRIISARRARKDERRGYYMHVAGGGNPPEE